MDRVNVTMVLAAGNSDGVEGACVLVCLRVRCTVHYEYVRQRRRRRRQRSREGGGGGGWFLVDV